MTADERLAELIVAVMSGNGPMTAFEIMRAIHRRGQVKTDARSVASILVDKHRFRRSRRRFFQRGAKWELVEVGPAGNPGTAQARVPARPFPPTLSGGAAVDLSFREDEPPTNAIGRTA